MHVQNLDFFKGLEVEERLSRERERGPFEDREYRHIVGLFFLKRTHRQPGGKMAGRIGEELEGRENGVDLTEMCCMLV